LTPSLPGTLPAGAAVAVLAPGTLVLRVYGPGRRWNQRRHYGPLPAVRFDHHRPPTGIDPERAVWDAARSVVGAVAETYGKSGFLDREAGDRVVVARVVAPVSLVDLVGVAARRSGLTQEIGTSTDYASTQARARALYDGYGELEGIRWRGRQAG